MLYNILFAPLGWSRKCLSLFYVRPYDSVINENSHSKIQALRLHWLYIVRCILNPLVRHISFQKFGGNHILAKRIILCRSQKA